MHENTKALLVALAAGIFMLSLGAGQCGANQRWSCEDASTQTGCTCAAAK